MSRGPTGAGEHRPAPGGQGLTPGGHRLTPGEHRPLPAEPTDRAPSFGARLAAAMDEHGPLCVGIDPHPALLDQWGLSDDVEGLRRFASTVVDALAGRVAALKPQSAFFERHGAGGVAVLEEVADAVRGTSTQLVLDAKRGDIGTTMAAYADAYLRAGAPLAADALTVSPYLGFGSLEPAVTAALASGRGLFVLALTSNKEGASVQHAREVHEVVSPDDGRDLVRELAIEYGVAAGTAMSVAGRIAVEAAALNTIERAETGAELGSVGLVVGATVGDAVRRLGINLAAVGGPLLAPGMGAQGAGAAELADVFGDAGRAVLASVSRGVLGAGPDPVALVDAARGAADDAAAVLRTAG